MSLDLKNLTEAEKAILLNLGKRGTGGLISSTDNQEMKVLTAAAVTFVVVTVLAAPVFALECMPEPLKTSLAQAQIVLVGQVESVRYASTPGIPGASHYIATVRVKRIWKGSTPTIIELHQPWVGGGMGLDQFIGAHYLFFLWQLTPDRPLRNPPNPLVTSGYRAAECISKQVLDSYDSPELGKSYLPTP